MATKIEEIRNLNDPQKAYKWRAFLPNFTLPALNSRLQTFAGQIPNITGAKIGGVNFDATIASQTEALANGVRNELNQKAQFFNPSIQVEEVQGLPFPGVDREAFYEAGRNTYFPSLEDVGSFSIVFYQDASKQIPDYIMEWKRRIVNEDGTKNLPNSYKMPINVQLLNGKNKVTLDMTMVGCFPIQTSGYNLVNQSENLKLTQEFSVDRVRFNPVFDVPAAFKQDIQDKLSNKVNDFLIDDSNFTFS